MKALVGTETSKFMEKLTLSRKQNSFGTYNENDGDNSVKRQMWASLQFHIMQQLKNTQQLH